ncbi:MAG TPA: undecaprenyldiphospho-muramoylpentapeptide beta-N-acetylglucosaminyltransferase [Sorangium sp.]|nr:undecaprenyldiphospho-muramoylpentapeptide beta-N-acetylglucosaminyltransferase [Sorangium sp.]
MTTILIAGGGTGGHVFPMVAVGQALRHLRPDVEVVYVGTGRGLESTVVPRQGGRLELLDVLPLRGGGVAGFARGGWRAAMVLPQARALVKRLNPDVVFSVGGYAAGPVTLVARSLGVPVTLLEPNSVSGFTNRLLRPLVQRAYVGFPETARGFDAAKVRLTGVPLRSRFAAAPYAAAAPPRLLVMGGSLGAQALNEALPRAIKNCVEAGVSLSVVHQTGRDKDGAVRALYQQLSLCEQVEVKPFIDDVAAALADSQLVVERAGAGALAELCAVGRPAILIPYPYAADDHQWFNAKSLGDDGAAVCVRQTEADVARLTDELLRLLQDADLRARMAQKSARRGRPDAAADIARDLLSLADAPAAGTAMGATVAHLWELSL